MSISPEKVAAMAPRAEMRKIAREAGDFQQIRKFAGQERSYFFYGIAIHTCARQLLASDAEGDFAT